MKDKSVIDTRVTINPDSRSFLDRLILFIRHKGLAYKTEKIDMEWIQRFIKFHNYQKNYTWTILASF